MPPQPVTTSQAGPAGAAATGAARRWWVLLAGTFSLVAACVFQYGLPFLVPTLRAAGLSLTEVAWLVSAPVIGVLSCLILWGAVADRWGERWVLAGGLTGAGLLLWAATTAGSALTLGVYLVLAGGSASAVQVASGRLILGWFAVRERGLAMGLRQTAQPLGVGLAALTLPHLSTPVDARPAGNSMSGVGIANSLLLMGAICLAAAVVIAVMAKDPAHVRASTAPAASPYTDGYLARIHLASALLVIPQFGVAAFAFDYLVSVRGVGAGLAGGVLAAAQGGGAVARLSAGWWSDRLGSRLRPVRVLALVTAAAALAAGLFAAVAGPELPTAVVLGIAAVFGVSTNGLSFTAVAERAPRGWAGRALGVQNTGQNAVAVLTAPALAALISTLGNRAGYPAAFLVLVVPALAAAVIIPVNAEPPR